MHRYNLPLVVLVFVSLSLMAAETTPVTGKAEAAVDRTPDKYKKVDAQRFWVTPEFLLYWTKDGPVKDVFVTREASPGSGFLFDSPGVRFLFAENKQDYGMQLGGRLTAGMWVDDARQWGVELSGFALEEKTASFHYTQSGAIAAGIPFYLTNGNTEGAYGFHFGDQAPGSIRIESSSQLWGVEGLGLRNVVRSDKLSLDASFGVKHLDLSEDFIVKAYENGQTSPFPEFSYPKDSFETHNQFYGAKLGLKFNLTAWERLLVNIEPAVSLGAQCEHLRISGHSVQDYGPPSPTVGGILTAGTNIGDYTKTKFAVVPEVKLGLGCKITKSISFNANYNFLYVSNVVRPGEQVTRRVNGDNIPSINGLSTHAVPLDPAPRFRTSDYWAHGLGVNLKIQF